MPPQLSTIYLARVGSQSAVDSISQPTVWYRDSGLVQGGANFFSNRQFIDRFANNDHMEAFE